ncbi:YdiK family protein [Bacillus sp. FJAT-49736]|uniref:YdiK family protein n=1 Tax=Bacillus sp. FJAT-49736 TaxID=2833582 RepID=UPI001BCA0DD0|nr:YdiK family protein [Bacillus sp. FJAT-49736]MBS4175840.1 YdiK family protein [Bacillus sp. FJAT-49736]
MRAFFSGIIYCLLGVIFTYMATQRVATNGWGPFTYILILLATLDFGAGIRLILLYFKINNGKNK